MMFVVRSVRCRDPVSPRRSTVSVSSSPSRIDAAAPGLSGSPAPPDEALGRRSSQCSALRDQPSRTHSDGYHRRNDRAGFRKLEQRCDQGVAVPLSVDKGSGTEGRSTGSSGSGRPALRLARRLGGCRSARGSRSFSRPTGRRGRRGPSVCSCGAVRRDGRAGARRLGCGRWLLERAACGVPGSQEGTVIWGALIRTIVSEPDRDPRPAGTGTGSGPATRPGWCGVSRDGCPTATSS